MLFTIVVMMGIFIAGLMLGCCCSMHCCRVVRAAPPVTTPPTTEKTPEPPTAGTTTRPTTRVTARTRSTRATASSAAAEEDLQELLLQSSAGELVRPQVIYVTTFGSQYHVRKDCSGLGAAKTTAVKFACLTCIGGVDGDGLRRRAH